MKIVYKPSDEIIRITISNRTRYGQIILYVCTYQRNKIILSNSSTCQNFTLYSINTFGIKSSN